MARAPSWRKIEAALIEIAYSYGYSLDEDRDSGDKTAELDIDGDTINLTDLARELEDRL